MRGEETEICDERKNVLVRRQMLMAGAKKKESAAM